MAYKIIGISILVIIYLWLFLHEDIIINTFARIIGVVALIIFAIDLIVKGNEKIKNKST